MEDNDMIGAVEEYVLQNTKKRMNVGELKAERIELFEKLLALAEENKHVNQWK